MKAFPKTLATALALAAAVAAAQQAPKPEQQIRWRQSAFQVLAWNNARIKSSLDGKYDKDAVLRSANAIAALANAGLPTLFTPGTETGNGFHATSAKPEAFKDADKFAAANAEFVKEAGELARVAQAGDAAAVKEQFGKLGKTCKSCHDDFRNTN